MSERVTLPSRMDTAAQWLSQALLTGEDLNSGPNRFALIGVSLLLSEASECAQAGTARDRPAADVLSFVDRLSARRRTPSHTIPDGVA